MATKSLWYILGPLRIFGISHKIYHSRGIRGQNSSCGSPHLATSYKYVDEEKREKLKKTKEKIGWIINRHGNSVTEKINIFAWKSFIENKYF